MNTTLKRIGIGFAVAVLVIGALVGAMFAFGKPMTSQAPPQSAASAEVGAPVGESDPFAVQIPGCVCHSDDPAVVEAHATYRMSQCFDCHRDGMPEMGQ